MGEGVVIDGGATTFTTLFVLYFIHVVITACFMKLKITMLARSTTRAAATPTPPF